MLAKLIFRLPEEREDFELAQNGWKYKSMIDDIYNKLRSLDKYTETESMTIEEIREMVREIEKEYE